MGNRLAGMRTSVGLGAVHSCLAVVLACAVCSGEDAAVDPEHVRDILLAEAEASAVRLMNLQCRERIVWRRHDDAVLWHSDVQWWLYGPLGTGVKRHRVDTTRDDGGNWLFVQRGDRLLVAERHEGGWRGYTQEARRETRTPDACFNAYWKPFDGRTPWVESLRTMHAVEATRHKGQLSLVMCPLKASAESIRAGTAGTEQGVTGALGWRCTLEKGNEGYRLLRIEHLESKKVRMKDENGVWGWADNPRRVPGTELVELQKGVTCYVTAETAFEHFMNHNGIVYPLRCIKRLPALTVVAEIDDESIERDTLDSEEALLHIPEDFGARGVHVDVLSGERTVYGDFSDAGNEVIKGLLAAGSDLRREAKAASAEEEESSTAVLAVVGSGIVLIGVLLMTARKRRREVRRER